MRVSPSRAGFRALALLQVQGFGPQFHLGSLSAIGRRRSASAPWLFRLRHPPGAARSDWPGTGVSWHFQAAAAARDCCTLGSWCQPRRVLCRTVREGMTLVAIGPAVVLAEPFRRRGSLRATLFETNVLRSADVCNHPPRARRRCPRCVVSARHGARRPSIRLLRCAIDHSAAVTMFGCLRAEAACASRMNVRGWTRQPRARSPSGQLHDPGRGHGQFGPFSVAASHETPPSVVAFTTGRMVMVHSARDPDLGREVALKVIAHEADASSLERSFARRRPPPPSSTRTSSRPRCGQSRSAIIGSTAAARRAGRYDAARATTPSTRGMVANVSGS